MAFSSTLPSDFEALLPAASDNICDLIKKEEKRAELKYKVIKILFTSERKLTPEFASALCAIRATCPEPA